MVPYDGRYSLLMVVKNKLFIRFIYVSMVTGYRIGIITSNNGQLLANTGHNRDNSMAMNGGYYLCHG